MTKDQKLEVLNSIEILDYKAEEEILHYALVENNIENVVKLKSIGVTYPDLISYYSDDEETIDISSIAWKYTSANWFDGNEFTII